MIKRTVQDLLAERRVLLLEARDNPGIAAETLMAQVAVLDAELAKRRNQTPKGKQ